MNYSLTTVKNDRQFIRCSKPVWEDGLKILEQVGFIEVQPEHAERNLAKFEAGELGARFGAFNETTQLYTMEVVKAGVLEHA